MSRSCGSRPARGDQPADRRRRHDLGRVRAGHVVDALLLDGAVQVVRAEPERRLRHADARGNPERLDVRNVVQHQAGHGVDAQRVGGGRRRQLAHLVVVGVERQRDERLEAAGLVLQRPRPQHVIDALLERLDVPVEHRDVRAHPQPVRGAVDGEPAIGVGLVVAESSGGRARRTPRRRRRAANRGPPRAARRQHLSRRSCRTCRRRTRSRPP